MAGEFDLAVNLGEGRIGFSLVGGTGGGGDDDDADTGGTSFPVVDSPSFPVMFLSTRSMRLRKRKKKKTATNKAMAPKIIPIAMPAFVPELKPVDEEDVFGSEPAPLKTPVFVDVEDDKEVVTVCEPPPPPLLLLMLSDAFVALPVAAAPFFVFVVCGFPAPVVVKLNPKVEATPFVFVMTKPPPVVDSDLSDAS